MKKEIKPCGIDLHIKYCCYKCQNIIWLSLAQARTENFICVCDICNSKFSPKVIDKIVLKYAQKKAESIESKKEEAVKPRPQPEILDPSVKRVAVDSLVKFGFMKDEAGIMIMEAFDVIKLNDTSLLVKTALKNCKGSHNV